MIELNYTITLVTPLHIGSGYGFAGYIDRVVVRNSQGQVYLPGSTIKGKARWTARRLAPSLGFTICPPEAPCHLARGANQGPDEGAPCVVCTTFGGAQFPGSFYFDNLYLPADYQRLLQTVAVQDQHLARQAFTGQRTNVMLDRQRRAARPNHLFTTELVQTDLAFTGRITGNTPQIVPTTTHEAVAEASIKFSPSLLLLWSALELITHIGQARSRGLGRCKVDVTSLTAEEALTRSDFGQALHVLNGGMAR